jgi:hypothetical protein
MSHQAVCLSINAGQQVPEAYLTKLLESYKTCIGYAFADDDGTIPIFQSNGTADIASFREVEKEYGANNLHFFFGNYEANYHDDDLQPFVLLKDGDGNCLACAFGEGSFPGYVHDASNHSEFFFCFTEYLFDEVQEPWHKGDMSLDKLAEDLDGPMFRKRIMNVMGSRGEITILLGNGKVVNYLKNNVQGANFAWGHTSNKLDYNEAVGPSSNLKDKETLKLKLTSETAPPASVPSVKPSEELIYPPNDQKHGKSFRKWRNRHFCKNISEAEAAKGISPSLLRPESALRKTFKSLEEAEEKLVAQAAAVTLPDKGTGMTTERPPIIPNGVLKQLIDEFHPSIKEFIDPEELPKLEKRFASYFQQTNYTPADALTWTMSDIYRLGATNVHALAVLFNSVRCMLYAKDPTLFKKGKPVADAAAIPMQPAKAGGALNLKLS